MRQTIRATIAALSLSALPTGCAYQLQAANHLVAYNKAFADARNQMLLLNAVRGSKHHPMFFTGASTLAETLGVEGDAQLTAVATGGASVPPGNSLTPQLTFKGTKSLLTTMNILDTKEFMQGILSPVKPELIKGYLEQGWPPE